MCFLPFDEIKVVHGVATGDGDAASAGVGGFPNGFLGV